MGGHAFKREKEITFPRMSTEVYLKCVDAAVEKLLTILPGVACPRKQPDKTTHGDLDILAVFPPGDPVTPSDVAAALGAKYHRGSTRDDVHYYGVCSKDLHKGGKEDEFVQIDIETCSTYEEMKWREWDQDFGDVTKIVGSIVKPFGLTINPGGLWLRLAEIEPTNHDSSLVLLTSDPDDAMIFLGLDVDEHHRGFETDHDVFTWITKSPLYSSAHVASRIPKWLADKNDIKRRMSRDMFKEFVEVWTHSNPITPLPATEQPTRENVVEKALKSFNIGEIYDVKIKEHQKTSRHQEMRQKIIDTISAIMLSSGKDQPSSQMLLNGYQRWVEVDKEGVPFLSPYGGRKKAEPLPTTTTSHHSPTSSGSSDIASESPIGQERDKLMLWLDDCTLTVELLGDWVRDSWVLIDEMEAKHSEMRRAAQLAKRNRKKEQLFSKQPMRGAQGVISAI